MRRLTISLVLLAVSCGPAVEPLSSAGSPSASTAAALTTAPPRPTLAPKPTSLSAPLGPPLARVSWSADRVGADYKVAFYAVGGHAVSLILFDPGAREIGRIPITGSGIWGLDSCVAQLGANLIGEVKMSSAQYADFSTRWATYVVRVWGSPNEDMSPGAVVPLVDTGCRATRQ